MLVTAPCAVCVPSLTDLLLTHSSAMHFTMSVHSCPDCAVCSEGYSHSIGYRCSQCSSSTSTASYAILAALAAAAAAVLAFIAHEMLSVGDVRDAVEAASQATSQLSSCTAQLRALSWSKLRAPVVVFQILTQFVSITGLQLPDLYSTLLSWLDVLNFNIGWTFSLGYVYMSLFKRLHTRHNKVDMYTQ
jgi:hypothetical protein